MSQAPKGWTDQKVEQIVGNLLRVGVIASGVLVLLGGILYLIQEGTDSVAVHNYQTFHGVPDNLQTLSGIVTGALAWHGQSLIQLGLLLLIATPVARVLFTIFAFLMQRDALYVAITLIVFVILIYSLFWKH